SRKMKKDEERIRWREFGESSRQKQEGIIFRTACENRSLDDINAELDYSRKKYDEILERQKSTKPPTLLFEANHIVEKIFDNINKEEVEEIVIDDSEMYRILKNRFN